MYNYIHPLLAFFKLPFQQVNHPILLIIRNFELSVPYLSDNVRLRKNNIPPQ